MRYRSLFFFLFYICAHMRIVTCASEPSFTTHTYPKTVSFREGSETPGGTEIHTFYAIDDEAGVLPFLQFSYDPASTTSMLDVVVSDSGSTRQAVFTLKTYELFDYETQDTFKITATANDTKNSVTVLLTIQVEDVGEAPTMNPVTPSQSFTREENAIGTVIGSPSFTIEDGDDLEVHVWSIIGGNGTGYVSINANNGTITLIVDYDRDNVAYAEDFYVDVAVTDKYSLSVTTTYFVTITDRNDNIPVCSPAVYSFNVNNTTPLGTTLTTITCTDADISWPNNEITYSFQSTDGNADYFNITGTDIKLETITDQIYGDGPFTIYVLAIDGGTPAYTGTATLSYTVPAATTLPLTTTEVPEPKYDALSSDSNLTLLLIIAAFIAACILGYVIVLCWRWNTFGQCLPRQCPGSNDCRQCCTCCPGDDIEKAVIIGGTTPSGFVMTKAGMPFGSEAPNSRRHIGSGMSNMKKAESLGLEAPNSRRHMGNSNNEKRGSFLGPEALNSRRQIGSGKSSEKKAESLGSEAPSSRRHMGSSNNENRGSLRGPESPNRPWEWRPQK